MSVRDELKELLKPGKLEKPYHNPSCIIVFDVNEGESPLHVLCFEEQVEKAMYFLMDHEKVKSATAAHLGSHIMGYHE